MQYILIADDNEDIREVLSTYVVKEGFEPIVAEDGIEAFETFKKCNPAVVLLDIMMPGLDGYKVCQKIREISQVPIILITAKGEDYERVMGLDIGADDYIVKPFSPNEVMARVRAVLRRMGRGEEEKEKKVLTVGDLTINIEAYTVFVGTEKIPMTKKEVETMWILAKNQAKYLPGTICLTVCGGRIILATAALWIHISRDFAPNWTKWSIPTGRLRRYGGLDTNLSSMSDIVRTGESM